MYYRLEARDECISIRHVETDREVGYVCPGEYIHPGRSGNFLGCTIRNLSGQELATITTANHPRPFECAAIAAATYQEHYSFPDLKGALRSDQADRVERRLGGLLADTVGAFARAIREANDGEMMAETTYKFAESLSELAQLWWASRLGCFDATSRTQEPYFASPLPSGPRLTFSGAAQVYGMRELRERYPDISEAQQQKLLGWVLRWLGDALSNELEEQKKENWRS
jgi:hypothetical protein